MTVVAFSEEIEVVVTKHTSLDRDTARRQDNSWRIEWYSRDAGGSSCRSDEPAEVLQQLRRTPSNGSLAEAHSWSGELLSLEQLVGTVSMSTYWGLLRIEHVRIISAWQKSNPLCTGVGRRHCRDFWERFCAAWVFTKTFFSQYSGLISRQCTFPFKFLLQFQRMHACCGNCSGQISEWEAASW